MIKITRWELLGAVGLGVLSVPVQAQEAPADEGTGSPSEGEIVVTAQRRSERLQDVPVSVTALTGDALAEQRLQQVSDLAGSVPNLQASPAGGDGIPIFSLRGISLSDFSANQQGPVATYFDDVYLGSTPLLPLGMFDLERVEVLRGPQGTLYGKNTTGGAINFISRRPGYDSEGYLKLGYGNYNRFDAEGAVQTALGNKAAARIAFTFARADGWFDNQFAGRPDPSAVRQYGVRASLLLEPSDKLDFVFRLSTSLQNPINYGILAKPGPDGVGAGLYEAFGVGSSYFRTGLGRREIESNYVERARQRTYGAALTTNLEMNDSLTLTSVTAYNTGEAFVPEDTDGSPLKVIEADYPSKAHQFSQDLRLASDFTGPFDFILGAYFNDETIRGGTTYRYFNDLDVNGDGGVDYLDCLDPNAGFFLACTYQNSYRQEKRSVAVYSDMSYDLSERLILRGGLRYTRDTGRLSEFKAQLLGADGTPLANTVPGDPVDFDATTGMRFSTGTITGKLGIDFKTASGNLLYASYSRGYRGKAFNAQAYFSPDELSVAKAETVNAYEVGFKTQFLDRRVTLNGAAFYYDYRNQQALDIDSATNLQTLVNIPKSRVIGGELELTARATDAFRINAGLGLLDTQIREGALRGISLVGNDLPNAPTVSLNAGFDWNVLDTGLSKLTVSLDGSYTSKQYYDLFDNEDISQRGYALMNGQIAYRFGQDRYGVALWGKNLFNRYYQRYAVELMDSFGYNYFHLGDPRTYGVSVDARF